MVQLNQKDQVEQITVSDPNRTIYFGSTSLKSLKLVLRIINLSGWLILAILKLLSIYLKRSILVNL